MIVILIVISILALKAPNLLWLSVPISIAYLMLKEFINKSSNNSDISDRNSEPDYNSSKNTSYKWLDESEDDWDLDDL